MPSKKKKATPPSSAVCPATPPALTSAAKAQGSRHLVINDPRKEQPIQSILCKNIQDIVERIQQACPVPHIKAGSRTFFHVAIQAAGQVRKQYCFAHVHFDDFASIFHGYSPSSICEVIVTVQVEDDRSGRIFNNAPRAPGTVFVPILHVYDHFKGSGAPKQKVYIGDQKILNWIATFKEYIKVRSNASLEMQRASSVPQIFKNLHNVQMEIETWLKSARSSWPLMVVHVRAPPKPALPSTPGSAHTLSSSHTPTSIPSTSGQGASTATRPNVKDNVERTIPLSFLLEEPDSEEYSDESDATYQQHSDDESDSDDYSDEESGEDEEDSADEDDEDYDNEEESEEEHSCSEESEDGEYVATLAPSESYSPSIASFPELLAESVESLTVHPDQSARDTEIRDMPAPFSPLALSSTPPDSESSLSDFDLAPVRITPRAKISPTISSPLPKKASPISSSKTATPMALERTTESERLGLDEPSAKTIIEERDRLRAIVESYNTTLGKYASVREVAVSGSVKPGDSYQCPIDLTSDTDEDTEKPSKFTRSQSPTSSVTDSDSTLSMPSTFIPILPHNQDMCILPLRQPSPIPKVEAAVPTSPRAVLEKCQPAVDELLRSSGKPRSPVETTLKTSSGPGMAVRSFLDQLAENLESVSRIKRHITGHPDEHQLRLIVTQEGIASPIVDKLSKEPPTLAQLDHLVSASPYFDLDDYLTTEDIMRFTVTSTRLGEESLFFQEEYAIWRAQQSVTSALGQTVNVSLNIMPVKRISKKDKGKERAPGSLPPSPVTIKIVPELQEPAPAICPLVLPPPVTQKVPTGPNSSASSPSFAARTGSPVTAQRYLHALLDNSTNTEASSRLLRILISENVDLDSGLGMSLLDLAFALRKDGELAATPVPALLVATAQPEAVTEAKKAVKPTKAEYMIQEVLNKLNDHSEMLNAIAQVTGVDVLENDESDYESTVGDEVPKDNSLQSDRGNTNPARPLEKPTVEHLQTLRDIIRAEFPSLKGLTKPANEGIPQSGAYYPPTLLPPPAQPAASDARPLSFSCEPVDTRSAARRPTTLPVASFFPSGPVPKDVSLERGREEHHTLGDSVPNLTVAERLRAQGLAKSYVLRGDGTEQRKQLGSAGALNHPYLAICPPAPAPLPTPTSAEPAMPSYILQRKIERLQAQMQKQEAASLERRERDTREVRAEEMKARNSAAIITGVRGNEYDEVFWYEPKRLGISTNASTAVPPAEPQQKKDNDNAYAALCLKLASVEKRNAAMEAAMTRLEKAITSRLGGPIPKSIDGHSWGTPNDSTAPTAPAPLAFVGRDAIRGGSTAFPKPSLSPKPLLAAFPKPDAAPMPGFNAPSSSSGPAPAQPWNWANADAARKELKERHRREQKQLDIEMLERFQLERRRRRDEVKAKQGPANTSDAQLKAFIRQRERAECLAALVAKQR